MEEEVAITLTQRLKLVSAKFWTWLNPSYVRCLTTNMFSHTLDLKKRFENTLYWITIFSDVLPEFPTFQIHC